MGRSRTARAFLEELIRKKQECNRRKQVLERYLQKLHEKYLRKEIPYSRYIETIYKKTDNKTLHEWIEYYDDYIKDCEKRIKKQKIKLIARNIPIYFLSFILIGFLISSVFYITPVFIGFLVQEDIQTFTETLSLQFNQSSEFEWFPENLGTLNSVKLSGSINGKGNVKVYLDDFLILSNLNINSNIGITGQVVSEVGQDSSSEKINDIGASQEDSTPSQEEPLFSENITTQIGQVDNVTENITEAPEEITDFVNFFTDLCEETCTLSEFNLNKTSYTLRIEISGSNILLNIDEIIYEIFTETLEIIEEIPEENITEIIPLENVTATIQTTQFQAVLGQPVKWKKDVQLDKQGIVKIKLPKNATNISVIKIEDGLEKNISTEEINEEASQIEDSTPSQEEPLPEDKQNKSQETLASSPTSNQTKAKFTITAQVIKEEEKGFFLLEFFKNIFSAITGLIVDVVEQKEEIEITIEDNATSYEIEYFTDAPYAIEEDIERGKRVKIVGPETVHYQNVLVFTNLSESLNIRNPSSVRVHWIENNTFIQPEQVLDLNDNGIYDYVSWVVPELSNQTFDIIVITKAEHLDSNREFISDIYEEVKALDGVWSETIPNQDYVRVTFEIPLDSSRDITIYPRTITGNPRIEVYEFNQSELIAEFTSLNDNEYNKILLTNLIGEQDVFDLRVLGGSVEIDHIIDPPGKIDDAGVFPILATSVEIGVNTNMATAITHNNKDNEQYDIFIETAGSARITDVCGANEIIIVAVTEDHADCSPNSTNGNFNDFVNCTTNFPSGGGLTLNVNYTIQGCANGGPTTYQLDQVSTTGGQDAFTGSDTLTVTAGDSTPPTIIIDSPKNTTLGPEVDYVITVDEALDVAFASVDGGANKTMTNDSL